MIIIDGFNLIYKFSDLEDLMYENDLVAARKGLLKKLSDFQKIKKVKIVIVFDGKKEQSVQTKKESLGNIKIFYSHDLSADYIIKQLVKNSLNPKMTTVVTSDKDIIFYINRFKAKSILSEKFALYLNNILIENEEKKNFKPEKDENVFLDSAEIEYWEKIFKIKN